MQGRSIKPKETLSGKMHRSLGCSVFLSGDGNAGEAVCIICKLANKLRLMVEFPSNHLA